MKKISKREKKVLLSSFGISLIFVAFGYSMFCIGSFFSIIAVKIFSLTAEEIILSITIILLVFILFLTSVIYLTHTAYLLHLTKMMLTHADSIEKAVNEAQIEELELIVTDCHLQALIKAEKEQ